MPCLYCKGAHVYELCPVYARSLAQVRVQKSVGTVFSGGSPAPFVGRFNYPSVNVGILTPPDVREDAWQHDAPRWWAGNGFGVPVIADFRASLVQSMAGAHVKNGGKLVEVAQEVAMACRPVDVEVVLKKVPNFKLSLDSTTSPMGPAGVAERVCITSNPVVVGKVEKAVGDTDLLAGEALVSLFQDGIDENQLSKLLSVGLLGVGKNRKLVPTRWSITATDDLLGKALCDEVRVCKVAETQVLFGGYVGNYYFVLVLPQVWCFELFEIALPGVYDPMGGVSTDWEDLSGRKSYAVECAGGYYSVRLAVLEGLLRMKRQAGVLVFRFITSEYSMPLGVWVTREASRKAMAAKPVVFSSSELLIKYVVHLARRKFGYDIEPLLVKSKLLRAGKQKRLGEF